MKALVKERPEPGLSLLDIEKPQVRNADDVQFKVEYCAICVGEAKVYEWNEWAEADKTIQLPTVLGHEASGVVTEIGSDVKSFLPGDRIVVDTFIPCGHCYQCRNGRTNICVDLEIYGKRRGAFAEYAVLPERVVSTLPAQLSLEEGALLENLSVAVHAVEREPHDPGDVAVVIGAGPIGILAAQTLAAYGVHVAITDMVDSRLNLAEEISRATVVDIRQDGWRKMIRDMSDGRGADYVIEAAATQSALDQAFEVVRDGGTVVTIGTFNEPVSFNPFFTMTRKEVRLLGSIGRTWETWRRMTQLVDANQVELKPLITHILPMEKFDRGFELVKSHDVMKVLLRP